jgi:hypothetical protein
VVIPARQACRAATLGDKSAAARSISRSVLAGLVIVDPALIRSTDKGAYGYHNV